MIELVLGVSDLARVRFAWSPMDELVHCVGVLAGRKGGQLHRSWVAMARVRPAGSDLTVLDALTRLPAYLPDFLMPPPEHSGTLFADELDRVGHAEPPQVRRDPERYRELPPVFVHFMTSRSVNLAGWRVCLGRTGRPP